jgi:hypothetical protein
MIRLIALDLDQTLLGTDSFFELMLITNEPERVHGM